MLLMEQRGWHMGREVGLMNVQSPITEGVFDRSYALVGVKLIQFLARRNPNAFAVGMGNTQNPFARLLAAAGWNVAPVPFQFTVIRAGRFLREIGPLRKGPRKIAAHAAALTGLPSLALGLRNLARSRLNTSGYQLEPASAWPDALDSVWQASRGGIALSVLRDAATVADLHPAEDRRLHRFLLRRAGEVVGWSSCLLTPMRNNSYFGNLRVGTILDSMAGEAHLDALLALTQAALADSGAEIIVANHRHARWRQALARQGWFNGPSNFLLAISKPLARTPLDQIYLTRADGDGRVNL
jgi:hypothetical protein